MKRGIVKGVLVGVLALLTSSGTVLAEALREKQEGDILVRFREDFMISGSDGTERVDPEVRRRLELLGVGLSRWHPSARVYRARVVPAGQTTLVLQELRRDPAVLYAEPNQRRHPLGVVPNDPYFPQQWALERIRMLDAWSVTVGTNAVLMAVADTGIEWTHPDLGPNLWKNGGEICGNSKDDDGNGYVDDCYGVNVIEGTGDVSDAEGHGTHVSGVAAAVGNNGLGVTGINWRISVMALKFLGPSGGTVADFLEALEYARGRKVRVMNLSFGAYGYSQAERDAIASAGDVLFVAAAGNESSDNDLYPFYPASYDLPNLVAVAASDEQDNLASFSSYGLQSVAVAAPGTDILGTYLRGAYQRASGTSAATAMVSGAAALLLNVFPTLPPPKIKERVFRTVDISDPPLNILTGGRLNVFRALTEAFTGPFIYRVIPNSGAEGAVITLRGASFGNTSGTVHFSGGVQGEIVSWSDEKITVRIPKGAVSGPIQVETAEGMSPPVDFTVRATPSGVRLRFAEVKLSEEHRSVLVLSNPTPEEVSVSVGLIETVTADRTIKKLVLKPFEKRFLWIMDMVPQESSPSLMVECVAEGFAGAAVVSVGPDFQPMKVIPHVAQW